MNNFNKTHKKNGTGILIFEIEGYIVAGRDDPGRVDPGRLDPRPTWPAIVLSGLHEFEQPVEMGSEHRKFTMIDCEERPKTLTLPTAEVRLWILCLNNVFDDKMLGYVYAPKHTLLPRMHT